MDKENQLSVIKELEEKQILQDIKLFETVLVCMPVKVIKEQGKWSLNAHCQLNCKSLFAP